MKLMKSSFFASPSHATSFSLLLNALAAFLVGLLALNSAQAASSLRTFWPVNGHFYHRIETGSISWLDAKQNCESRGAHLATISGLEEQAFITGTMLDGSTNFQWFHIGGTNAANLIDWKWITGENWAYQNWNANEPDLGENYLAIYSSSPSSSSRGQWYGVLGSDKEFGFICEWSADNFIDTALVPDLNGNGFDEIASLVVSYKTGVHLVIIRDSSTFGIVSILSFSQTFIPPQGMVVLDDIDGNGVPEIGVLFIQQGYPNVKIKDAKNNTKIVRSINFLSNLYKPKAISSTPDVNGNGSSEIVVLGVHKGTGRALSQVRDSKTGIVLGRAPF